VNVFFLVLADRGCCWLVYSHVVDIVELRNYCHLYTQTVFFNNETFLFLKVMQVEPVCHEKIEDNAILLSYF